MYVYLLGSHHDNLDDIRLQDLSFNSKHSSAHEAFIKVNDVFSNARKTIIALFSFTLCDFLLRFSSKLIFNILQERKAKKEKYLKKLEHYKAKMMGKKKYNKKDNRGKAHHKKAHRNKSTHSKLP